MPGVEYALIGLPGATANHPAGVRASARSRSVRAVLPLSSDDDPAVWNYDPAAQTQNILKGDDPTPSGNNALRI